MKYDRTIVAYHGCDKKTAERILAGEAFMPSENDFDWLGSGIYFWEFGIDRAMKFAEFQMSRGRVRKPAVVGALIQLGRCFDLMDTRYTAELPDAFEVFKAFARRTCVTVPKNEGATTDRKLRRRDCAVLNFYLESLAREGIVYDSVRCAFVEGKRAFSGSGIHQESHVQVCVRNPACVLGVFRPIM